MRSTGARRCSYQLEPPQHGAPKLPARSASPARARNDHSARRGRRPRDARVRQGDLRAGYRAPPCPSRRCAENRAASAGRLVGTPPRPRQVPGLPASDDDAPKRLRERMARERISLKVTRPEHADLVPFLAAARDRVSKMDRAIGASGTTCGRRAFIRSPGISHRAASVVEVRPTRAVGHPATSPGRCPVSRSAFSAAATSSPVTLSRAARRSPPRGRGSRHRVNVRVAALSFARFLSPAIGFALEQLLLDRPIEHSAEDCLDAVRLDRRHPLHVVQEVDDVPPGERSRPPCGRAAARARPSRCSSSFHDAFRGLA